MERRRLHNLVQQLQGNIRVYVRVKPLSAKELEDDQKSVLRCESDRRISCLVQGVAKVRPLQSPAVFRKAMCLLADHMAASEVKSNFGEDELHHHWQHAHVLGYSLGMLYSLRYRVIACGLS